MGSIGVLTDSTADLELGELASCGLSMVPLIVNWDGETFRDKVDLSTAEFYRRLRTSKTLPKTGAPSQAAFEAAFREKLKEHDAIVSVNIAAALSGTFEIARRAAESVDPMRISVVDSGTASVCLGFLAKLAGSLSEQGLNAQSIVDKLEEARGRMRILAVVETLDYLQRGGRIGRAAALAGTLLSVKPILNIKDGELTPVERVRTMNGALRRLVELAVALGPAERVGIMHADAAANADQLEAQLKPHFPALTMDRGELGPVVGTHGGPGVVGVGVFLAA
jgi:DegV family protein with EDD domain